MLRTRVDDGSWHEAKVTWVASGNKVIVTLSLDYDSEEVIKCGDIPQITFIVDDSSVTTDAL